MPSMRSLENRVAQHAGRQDTSPQGRIASALQVVLQDIGEKRKDMTAWNEGPSLMQEYPELLFNCFGTAESDSTSNSHYHIQNIPAINKHKNKLSDNHTFASKDFKDIDAVSYMLGP